MWSLLLLFLYSALLFFVYKKTKGKACENIQTAVFAGGGISSAVLIPGVFNSWLWTTSVIGAAEASIVYGFYGGVAFAVGTGIGVLVLISVLVRFKTIMGEHVFITDFISARFSEKTASLFYVASIILVVYIIIEQAVGMSSVFSALFSVSFKKAAFFSIVLAVIFVIFAGMRGVLFNDILSFILICGLMFFVSCVICRKYNVDSIISAVYSVRRARIYAEHSFGATLTACLRYGLSAMIIGFAQTVLDPAYYIRAHMAKDSKAIKTSFFVGGIMLWIPFVIFSSLLFGYMLFGFGAEASGSVNFSAIITNVLFLQHFSYVVKAAFAFFLLIIALTTIINGIMGIMGMCAIKIYPLYANSAAGEKEMLKYGKVLTVLIGLFCALIAISLEKVSLLTIDIFSGIFFSAPAGIILCGMFGRKAYGGLAVHAFILGIVLGFGTWIFVKDSGTDWFYATIISFVAPIVFLKLAAAAKGSGDFNFKSLKFYK